MLGVYGGGGGAPAVCGESYPSLVDSKAGTFTASPSIPYPTTVADGDLMVFILNQEPLVPEGAEWYHPPSIGIGPYWFCYAKRCDGTEGGSSQAFVFGGPGAAGRYFTYRFDWRSVHVADATAPSSDDLLWVTGASFGVTPTPGALDASAWTGNSGKCSVAQIVRTGGGFTNAPPDYSELWLPTSTGVMAAAMALHSHTLIAPGAFGVGAATFASCGHVLVRGRYDASP